MFLNFGFMFRRKSKIPPGTRNNFCVILLFREDFMAKASWRIHHLVMNGILITNDNQIT